MPPRRWSGPSFKPRHPPLMEIAEELAKQQKAISVAEFFEKNRQILGFDSAPRALITCVKEAVDNSLDACGMRHSAGHIRADKKSGEYFQVIVEIRLGLCRRRSRASLPNCSMAPDFIPAPEQRPAGHKSPPGCATPSSPAAGRRELYPRSLGQACILLWLMITLQNEPEIIKAEGWTGRGLGERGWRWKWRALMSAAAGSLSMAH